MRKSCSSKWSNAISSVGISSFEVFQTSFRSISSLLDNGYHPEHLTIDLKKICSQIMTKIKFELSQKPSKAEKKAGKVRIGSGYSQVDN